MHSTNECTGEGSRGEVSAEHDGSRPGEVKRREHSRQGGQQAQRSNGDRDVKHLETERTVRPGLNQERGGWGEMRPGRRGSRAALTSW